LRRDVVGAGDRNEPTTTGPVPVPVPIPVPAILSATPTRSARSPTAVRSARSARAARAIAAVIPAAPHAANLAAAAAPCASDGKHHHDRQRARDSHARRKSKRETKITYIYLREITS
jgi:hypothetical protein